MHFKRKNKVIKTGFAQITKHKYRAPAITENNELIETCGNTIMIVQQENHILELSSSNLKKPARNLHQLLQLPGRFSSNKDLIHSFCSQNTHIALKTEKKRIKMLYALPAFL